MNSPSASTPASASGSSTCAGASTDPTAGRSTWPATSPVPSTSTSTTNSPSTASPADGRHPLPSLERLQTAAQRWGIDPGDAVVVYDDLKSLSAARAWWLLTDAGIPDVRILDGSLRGWTDAGHPLEDGDVVPPIGGVDAVARPPVDASASTRRPTSPQTGVAARRPGRRSATSATSSRSIPVPGTSPVRATSRPRATSTPPDASSIPMSCVAGSRLPAPRRTSRSASTAGRASPHPTPSSHSPSPASSRSCTPARGASGRTTPIVPSPRDLTRMTRRGRRPREGAVMTVEFISAINVREGDELNPQRGRSSARSRLPQALRAHARRRRLRLHAGALRQRVGRLVRRRHRRRRGDRAHQADRRRAPEHGRTRRWRRSSWPRSISSRTAVRSCTSSRAAATPSRHGRATSSRRTSATTVRRSGSASSAGRGPRTAPFSHEGTLLPVRRLRPRFPSVLADPDLGRWIVGCRLPRRRRARRHLRALGRAARRHPRPDRPRRRSRRATRSVATTPRASG